MEAVPPPFFEERKLTKAKASALQRDDKTDEAVEVWRQFLGQHSNDAESANELGRILLDCKRYEEALQWLQRALAFRRLIGTQLDAGIALRKLKRFQEAISFFQDILAARPDHPAACFNLGVSLHALERHEQALKWLRRALDLRPSHIESAQELGNVLRALKRSDDAIDAYRQALSLDPDCLGALLALAALQHDARRFEDGSATYQRVIELDPDSHVGWIGLGGTLLGLARYAEALTAYRRALDLQPSSAIALCNMSLALSGLGRVQEGIEACRKAIFLEPGSAIPNFNLACLLLTIGNFREGWPGYEYRYPMTGKKWACEDVHAAPWIGEPLAGKSIFILGEQGNGDQIQFARYASALCSLGASVTYMLPVRLHRLLCTLPGSIIFVSEPPKKGRYDFQCPLMSLPGQFERLGLPIPVEPYLSAEAPRVARWKRRIGDHGFRVGIVWQGNRYPGGDGFRSYRLETLRPLAAISGVRLISLQAGEGTDQLGNLPMGLAVETLEPDYDVGDHSFLDAAAVMEAVDLVVTCDTSMAHLAGALGRPVWIALNQAPEWRWGRDRTDSVWYPTARLFRQDTRGDWDGVFVRMAHALTERLKEEAKSESAVNEPITSSTS
jgi:tetratricopeptide (TPR) repeat protein